MKLNKKNKLLVLAYIALLYICYAFAVKNTIIYYNQYLSQKKITESKTYTPQTLSQLNKYEKQLDSALLKYNYNNGASYQNLLLKNLAALAQKYNLTIVNFEEPHIITDNNVETTSYLFTLRGSFNGILLALNNMENNPVPGFVKHISFIKKINYKTNSDYLEATIILQKIEAVKV